MARALVDGNSFFVNCLDPSLKMWEDEDGDESCHSIIHRHIQGDQEEGKTEIRPTRYFSKSFTSHPSFILHCLITLTTYSKEHHNHSNKH
jgi:hypothetical protein